MEQFILFREGNVSTGHYSCYLCQRLDDHDWRIGELLISVFARRLPAREFFKKKLEWLRRKRPLQALLIPHLGLSDLIPKFLPIKGMK
jgi:hypothetical protein